MEQERKERKKQKEKERKERLKKEGKLLTKAQKEAKARAEATLKLLQAQGKVCFATNTHVFIIQTTVLQSIFQCLKCSSVEHKLYYYLLFDVTCSNWGVS